MCLLPFPLRSSSAGLSHSVPASCLSSKLRGNKGRNSHIWKGGQGGARGSKAGQKARVRVGQGQLFELLYDFPHGLEGNIPLPLASASSTAPPVGGFLTEEHMERRRETATKPEPTLSQAQRWQHPGGVEAGGQCGQVLLGHWVVQAQDAAADVQEHTNGFYLRGDGTEWLPPPVVDCAKRRSVPLEPATVRTIC